MLVAHGDGGLETVIGLLACGGRDEHARRIVAVCDEMKDR